MNLQEIRLDQLHEAAWNPNVMDASMRARLRRSVEHFGIVENLVVRPQPAGFEVLSGNQRLQVYRELGLSTAPCYVVELDDARARLLAQVLNRTRGEDDQGLKAAALKRILAEIEKGAVLALLPESQASLEGLASLGSQDLAAHIRLWDQAQAGRLKHVQFQVTGQQLSTIEEALRLFLPLAKGMQETNPNQRGNALFLLCRRLLERVRS